MHGVGSPPGTGNIRAMAGYQKLGQRQQLGVSDAQLQINPFLRGTGWNVIFTPVVWSTNITEFEIYQISLNGPLGSSVLMMINLNAWNYVQQGWNNYNDPVQPIPIAQTDEVEFCWNVSATAPPYNQTSNIQPTVTVWMRTEPLGP